MTITWLTFAIVLPLTFLGGFIEAVSGGGALVSLPAYMIAGLPTHYAIATNKLSAMMGISTATYRFARSGYIKWKRTAACLAAALCGGVLGAKLSLMLSDRYFKILMLFLLPATALYIMKSHALSDEKEPLGPVRTVATACVIALVTGVYDGFYGPGSGTFMILLLAGAAHLDLKEANATAKVINLVTCISSLTVYLINGKVVILLGLAAGIMSTLGAWIGTTYFEKGGVRAVKPLMIIVIVIFFIKILTEVMA